jgi:hypothetical protein
MRTIVGAYAAAARPIPSEAAFRSFVDGVFALDGVDGLEIPFMLSESHWNTLDYLRAAPEGSRHVLTLIPAMVGGMAERPNLGLASVDDDGRAAALAIVRRARDFVDLVNSGGGARIAAVELHSAPRRDAGSSEAFARSLQELSSWDWDAATLSVEHCDTLTDSHSPAKGFLTIEEEIAAAAPLGIGLVINWARSVIETRTADSASDHISLATVHGVLTGVVFSGCAPHDTAFGGAWEDAHLPMAGWSEVAPHARLSQSSLLTERELDRCVRLALQSPELEFLGIKVSAPNEANEAERLDLIAGNLRMLANSVGAARSAAPAGD